MAGNYSDVPGPRMAYDRDGTISLYGMSQSESVATPGGVNDLTLLNNESFDGVGSRYWTYLIFPQLRDIVGYAIHTSSGDRGIHTSTNTTTGLDGTWTSRGSYSTVGTTPQMRSISTVNWTGVKAIKVYADSGAYTWNAVSHNLIHLYGTISAGQTPDRLRIWHPTLDQEVTGAYFDWGDIQRNGASITKTFRIKNNSAALTANSIVLSSEALTDTTPTNAGQHTFAPDGVTFSSPLNIGNLAPGAISSEITVRRLTPTNAALSLWWTRINAVAGSWT